MGCLTPEVRGGGKLAEVMESVKKKKKGFFDPLTLNYVSTINTVPDCLSDI